MSNRSTPLTDTLHQYLLDVSLREPDVLRRLREATAELPEHNMQIAPEQGQFMQLLLKMMNARQVIEIGTFTGYSALAMAQALPADGRLLACDYNEEWIAMARPYWEEAGVADRIETRIAPAADTLATLLEQGRQGVFDFAFIDADKTGYDNYYEGCLELIRPGGVIAVDNTLWHGRVADDPDPSEDTRALRAFNRKLHSDERVDLSLVPIGDGVTLARKR
jgi:caffeoyl-CoA O-methyltransferase